MSYVIHCTRAMRAGILPAALCDRDLLVLLAYAEYASPDGRAWPANETIAAMIRLSRASVTRSIRALVTAGVLVRVTGRRHDTTIYRLAIPAIEGAHVDDPQPDDPQPDDPQQEPDDRQPEPLSSHDPPTPSGGPCVQDAQSEHPRKPKRRPRDPDKPPPHPRHRELLDRWLTLAEHGYGSRPATGGHNGGRIAASISKLLEAYGGDADKVLASMERSVQDRRQPTIHAIANDPDGYKPLATVVRSAPKKPTEARPRIMFADVAGTG